MRTNRIGEVYRLVLLCLCAVGVGATLLAPAVGWSQAVAEQPDRYQWLEDVSGARSMEWVKAENERTAKVLDADGRLAGMDAAALKILESPDRIPTPQFREGEVYNTWQDAEHAQGILRRTTLADYRTASPHWETVLDYDALSKKDGQKWVAGGLECLYPGDGLCLVALSSGGEDAQTLREFDLKTSSFVPGGFVLPRSKQSAAWVDRDTLLVARDWGSGTMTKSGYPYVVKLWKRGEPFEAAREVSRGVETDLALSPQVLHDAQGHQATLLVRNINFFEVEYSFFTPEGVRRLALPAKSNVEGLLDGRLIVSLKQDWKPEGSQESYAQGSVVSLDLAAAVGDPVHLKPAVVFAPTAREFAQSVSLTRNRLLLTTLAEVQGRAYVYTVSGTSVWGRTKLEIPENQTVTIVTGDTADDRFFLSRTGFLTPSSLELGDASTGKLESVKTRPAQFDASEDVVEQLHATSEDGTAVPYFVVHRKGVKYDGSNPTLLEAYGGFEVSMTPSYDPVMGKLWLERGGVYVLANIRGGGEFGPAWHEAGLTTHRQRIYDDFAAVGHDLVARKITTPRRLGILGGSNGGLLMGVEMTEHPEMWGAVGIEVPLLDMLRFEQIAAGASWTGEYGSVAVPEQRRFLASISPYNQLRPGVRYPEPFIFTTTKDDRVGPVHARKFAARMEEFHEPFLYLEITEGGHNAGADLKEKARTWATIYLYLTRKLED